MSGFDKYKCQILRATEENEETLRNEVDNDTIFIQDYHGYCVRCGDESERIREVSFEVHHAKLERELSDLLDLDEGDRLLGIDSNTDSPTKRKVRIARVERIIPLGEQEGEDDG